MTRAKPTYNCYVPMGDSLTVGYYATIQSNAYQYLLRGTIQSNDIGDAATGTYNGVYGGTLLNGLNSLPDVNAQLPDMITLEYGTNDVGNQTNLTTFTDEWDSMIQALTTNVNSGRFPLIVMLTTWNDEGGHSDGPYDTVIKQKAQQYGYQVVDLSPIYADTSTYGPAGVSTWTGTSDDFHPNDKGHQEIANAVWSVLQPLLDFSFRRPAGSRAVATNRTSASNRQSA